MRLESDPGRVAVPIHMHVMAATAELRYYYRSLREVGFGRHEANFLSAGVALATGTGDVKWSLK